MDTRQECLEHLFIFIQSGNIDKAASAAGTMLAYLAKLESQTAQLAALRRLQDELTDRCATARISDEAEDRHIAIEDAIAKARSALEKTG